MDADEEEEESLADFFEYAREAGDGEDVEGEEGMGNEGGDQ